MLPSLNSVVSSALQQRFDMGEHLNMGQSLMNQSFNQGFQTLPISATSLRSKGIEGISWEPSASGAGMLGNFKGIMTNSLQQLNKTVQAPNELMQQALSGAPVDVHDIIIANTKSELAVSLGSQMLTKAIQAYDRLNQIQV